MESVNELIDTLDGRIKNEIVEQSASVYLTGASSMFPGITPIMILTMYPRRFISIYSRIVRRYLVIEIRVSLSRSLSPVYPQI